MTSVASLYNSLPSVEEAATKFINRAHIFLKLASLLAEYEHKFGVCLVHAHCKLEEGEIMVSSGNVTQPERDVEGYPECWLASGEPYEFTKKPIASPPPELFSQFREIVDGIDVLGLYAVSAPPSSGILREHTDGRKNITTIVASADPQDIETAWLPGVVNPILRSCSRACVYDPIRGGKHHHLHSRG
ncbi:hypothetical protein GALMADRAFT_1354777 [Galerina marginata CBS 339.88]|uniref:Uncharacterized protein n=1 Tax=Galerina marginata (strain CBS 339.88) TaxID=685588 RepID=A0A067SND7_GALM3|nr:hypothetical protein GALMADRAFT_1354777 [Galerina marginata CBS 339.88]